MSRSVTLPKKPTFERVYDPNGGEVHASTAGLQEGVTLCGQLDWIGDIPGEKTDLPINCATCLSIINHCQSHRL